MFTTAFFLLGIIFHFKSGNTTSASALKDSLFISSSPEVFFFFFFNVRHYKFECTFELTLCKMRPGELTEST